MKLLQALTVAGALCVAPAYAGNIFGGMFGDGLTITSGVSTTGKISGTSLYITSGTLFGGPTVSSTGFVQIKQPVDSAAGGLMFERVTGGSSGFGHIWMDSNGFNIQFNNASNGKMIISTANNFGFGLIPSTRLDVNGVISGTMLRLPGTVSGGSACTNGQIQYSPTRRSIAVCDTATWVVLTSVTTVSNSGL